MNPIHYLQFLRQFEAELRAEYDKLKAVFTAEEEKYNLSIWKRWFRLEWDVNPWRQDYYKMCILGGMLRNEISAEIAKASYFAKMEKDTMSNPKYPEKFYFWADRNGIPYAGPAPCV